MSLQLAFNTKNKYVDAYNKFDFTRFRHTPIYHIGGRETITAIVSTWPLEKHTQSERHR